MKNKAGLFIITLSFISILVSCKKNKDTTTNSTVKTVEDSALSISRDFYIWYNQIPASFDANSYADPKALMIAIRAYSMEPGFSTAVDKWSFGVLKADWNQLSGGFGDASNVTADGDFGFSVFFNIDGDLRVKMVERLSPAGLAGIQRGWRVTKINGNTNITIANSDFIIANVFNSTSSTFTFSKPDGTSVDITLAAGHYEQQPVYLDTTYTIGSKKIGYLVLNSFLGDTAKINTDFQNVITNFSSKSVSDIVVDLRYNGGGYVSLQEKLADYLSPSSANGKVMMKETYNDKHQDYNTTLFFKKAGPLNPNHILFIVTPATASASELLINNLRPYMDVKLVGPGNTDGKPVGFFPIPAGDWYVFPVSFRSTNSAGYGGYFDGFTPDGLANDGLDKNWGDPTEASLAKAIKYITTGTFNRQAEDSYKTDPYVSGANKALNKISFKGSIDTRGMK